MHLLRNKLVKSDFFSFSLPQATVCTTNYHKLILMQATAEREMGGGFRQNSDSELKLKNRCTGSTFTRGSGARVVIGRNKVNRDRDDDYLSMEIDELMFFNEELTEEDARTLNSRTMNDDLDEELTEEDARSLNDDPETFIVDSDFNGRTMESP